MKLAILPFSVAAQNVLFLFLLQSSLFLTNADLSPANMQLNALIIKEADAIPNVDPYYALTKLIQNEVILDPYKVNQTLTMSAITLAYYSGEMPYSGCRNEVFGSDGEYTDLICDTFEETMSVVCKLEDACEAEEWNETPLYAFKGEALQNTELLARALCATDENSNYTVVNCPKQVYDQLVPAITQLQGLIQNFIPKGFANPLLSLGAIVPGPLTSEPDYVRVKQIRVAGIGDAFLDFRKGIYGEELMPIAIKSYISAQLAAFIRLAPETYYLRTEEFYFLIKGMQGYLGQKYKHMIYTKDELSSTFQEFNGPKYTDILEIECAKILGAYYAWNCTTLEDFMVIQDQIISSVNITTTNGCTDLVSKEYKDIIATGRKVFNSYTMGTRCTNGCTDSSEEFPVEGTSGTGMRTCDWAVRKGGKDNKGIPKSCKLYSAVKENCPDTCGTCCVDGTERFYVSDLLTKGKKRNCEWAGRKKSKWRCSKDGVARNCPQTCQFGRCAV